MLTLAAYTPFLWREAQEEMAKPRSPMRLLQEMEDWVREANALTEVQWQEMLTLVAAEERPKWLEDPLLGPDMVLRLQVLHVTATLTGLMERYYGAGSERHAYMHIPWWERKREP